jgi:hypothetical protein
VRRSQRPLCCGLGACPYLLLAEFNVWAVLRPVQSPLDQVADEASLVVPQDEEASQDADLDQASAELLKQGAAWPSHAKNS